MKHRKNDAIYPFPQKPYPPILASPASIPSPKLPQETTNGKKDASNKYLIVFISIYFLFFLFLQHVSYATAIVSEYII